MKKVTTFLSLLLLAFATPAVAQSWSLTGNAGAAGNFIGTTNNFGLSLRTANTERFAITSAGAYKFNTLTGNGSGLMMLNASGEVSRLGFSGGGSSVLTGAGSFTSVGTLTGWSSSQGTSATMMNVGIGTATPDSKLHVVGTTNLSGTLRFDTVARIDYFPASGSMPPVLRAGPFIEGPPLSGTLNLHPCFDPQPAMYHEFNGMISSFGASAFGGHINALNMGFDGANGIIDVAGVSDLPYAPRLLINYYCGKDVAICTGAGGGDVFMCDSGVVGIGTGYIPDGYKLAVNGKVIAEELLVRLRNTWPDYVFKPGYRLQPLRELELHIKDHGHLPGIPAASEMEANGVETGEMIRLQMQKIEELTLYLIEQDKKIVRMEEELKNLRK